MAVFAVVPLRPFESLVSGFRVYLSGDIFLAPACEVIPFKRVLSLVLPRARGCQSGSKRTNTGRRLDECSGVMGVKNRKRLVQVDRLSTPFHKYVSG